MDYVARTDNAHINGLHSVIFSEGGWAPLNFTLAKSIGFEESAVYGILLNMFITFYNIHELTPEGWFFCTVPYFEKRYGLKRKRQETIFKKLEAEGLIKVHYKGKDGVSSIRRYIEVNQKVTWLRGIVERGKEKVPNEED